MKCSKFVVIQGQEFVQNIYSMGNSFVQILYFVAEVES